MLRNFHITYSLTVSKSSFISLALNFLLLAMKILTPRIQTS